MTEPQDESLENQSEPPIQPASPSEPSEIRGPDDSVVDAEKESVDGNEPVPPQFQSPYFPNGVFEDARPSKNNGISYDPFAANPDGKVNPEKGTNRKTRIIMGVVMLILIAAIVVALVTGRLVIPF